MQAPNNSGGHCQVRKAPYVMRFPPEGATTMLNQCKKHWRPHPMHLPMPSPMVSQTALQGCNAAALVSRAGA